MSFDINMEWKYLKMKSSFYSYEILKYVLVFFYIQASYKQNINNSLPFFFL